MNRGAVGWGHPQPGYRGYRGDNKANCANRWSHHVGRLPSQSERHLVTDGACHSPAPKSRSVTREPDLDYLTKPERFSELKKMSDRFGKRYDGRGHSKYASDVKGYTIRCKKPLSYREQNRLIPCLQEFKPQTHWSWFSLTNITQSFTSAGLFTVQQHTDQAVRNVQAVLLTDLFDAVRYKCNTRPEASDIDTRGMSNLLWAMAKLVDNGQELTPKFKETATTLLPHVIRLQNHLDPLGITILIWSLAKLVDKSQELAPELKEVVVALLPHVNELRDQFNARCVANLLWAMAKLDNGQPQTTEFKEVMAALLPQVKALSDLFEPQAIANLLWAMAKVVDNGQELTSELKEAVAALLPRVNAWQAHFTPQEIANLLWAAAKLVDHGHELTTELNEAVVGALPCVKTLGDQFHPQGIANLLWAMAKMLDNGQELTREFREAVATSLALVEALQARFKSQEIASLLWAAAKLVDHGHELTTELKEAVATLLPRVKALQAHFKSQEITSLFWAQAKLVDHGHELTKELKETVATLLPRVKALQAHFKSQEIANLLWAQAKLVDHGYELTKELKGAVVVLLPWVKANEDQFIAQAIANLLWALAKLVEKGQELTPEWKEVLATLLSRVNALQVHFTPQQIASLLWATSSLGDFISTAAGDSLAESILCQSDKYRLFTQRELRISLWGLLVCSARHYLDKNISAENNTLECLINRLFTRLENESINDEQCNHVVAMAASWLGRECPFEPHYQTIISATQSIFCARLHCALPSLKIEQEKSLHSLPPVDLFLPEHNLAIEIQGPSHYAGRDFQTRNGATLLKIALLQKAGYDVLEIAANQLANPDVASMHIDRIRKEITANN